MATEQKCMCGEKNKEDCPGEWEPGCDLGNNEKYAVVHTEPKPEEKLKG